MVRVSSGTSAVLTAIVLILFASPMLAQVPQAGQPAGELKKLSLDELQQIEVTSVSRRPEK